MKKIVFVFLILILNSCKNNSCNCTEQWDITVSYTEGRIVSYNDTCWIAIHNGKGIIPGPWLENGNDIWQVCDEK
jgi:hypothetical protein